MSTDTPVKLVLTTADGERLEVDPGNWSWDMRPGDVLDVFWPGQGELLDVFWPGQGEPAPPKGHRYEGSITVPSTFDVIAAYNKAEADLSKYERRLLRDLNFGIPGGMSPRRIAEVYGVDVGTVVETVEEVMTGIQARIDELRWRRRRRQFRRASTQSRRARRTRATKEQRSSSRWWGCP